MLIDMQSSEQPSQQYDGFAYLMISNCEGTLPMLVLSVAFMTTSGLMGNQS